MNKATVLVNRINLFWGTSWAAVPSAFTKQCVCGYQTPDLVIGCVDTRAARKAVHNALTLRSQGTSYWLDIGNNAASGQYVLGQPLNMSNRRKAERLRTVAELYPEIADADAGEDELPNCSAVEALSRQEPFINQTLAASALAMLAQLFRYGKIAHHGAFYNAQTGRMSSLAIDPDQWAKTRRRNRRLQRAA
jgi:PRTRC genetic system ThiF family protein